MRFIDEIDTLHNLMFIFAFDSKLTEDENSGLKSYQALWMRIQNEIEGERYNRFNDMADLDMLAAQEYDNKVIAEMSRSLADIINEFYSGEKNAVIPLDENTSFTDRLSVPKKVNLMTLGSEMKE